MKVVMGGLTPNMDGLGDPPASREVARYTDLTRLSGNTGSSTQRQMATLKARLIARYRLHTIGGRPEELIYNIQPLAPSPRMVATPRGIVRVPQMVPYVPEGRTVSLGYGCGTIRIRKHGGPDNRQWVDHIDVTPNDGWHREVYDYLDPFFGFTAEQEHAEDKHPTRKRGSDWRDRLPENNHPAQ